MLQVTNTDFEVFRGYQTDKMRVLYVTNMYPNRLALYYGVFVRQEVDRLRSHGIEVDVVFINGRRNPLEYLKSPVDIFRALNKTKYDAINVQHTLLLPQTLFARKILRLNIPIIFTFHEGEIGNTAAIRNPGKALLSSYRSKTVFFRYLDLIITRNSKVFGQYKNVPVEEIPSPVEMDVFLPLDKNACREKLELIDDEPIVFFPADPSTPGKNFPFMQNIAQCVNNETGLQLRVLTGPVVHDKMPLYYNASDAVCLPSLYEASPVVIREAMACNRPIVTSDVGDIRRTIGDVDGCFVIDEWNEKKYAQSLMKAVSYGNTKGRDRLFDIGGDWESSATKLVSILNRSLIKKSEGVKK